MVPSRSPACTGTLWMSSGFFCFPCSTCSARIEADRSGPRDISNRMTAELSHFDASGASRMVDVGDKPVTARLARASGRVVMQPATLARIQQRGVAKGDVLEVARLAGIMAAKRTGELIPLCHPLPIDAVSIDFSFPDERT